MPGMPRTVFIPGIRSPDLTGFKPVMIIRAKASCSHHAPGLQCSHAVGCASFSHKGEGRGLFEPKPCTAAWNHLEVLYLWPYSFPAGKQPSERWEAGSTAGTVPCPRLPGALLTLQQCHCHTGAAQPSGQPCARLDVLTLGHPQSPETVTHPQLPWNGSSHPGAVVWNLLQLPTSGCCHPCPSHGPRTNCKDEMGVVLSGLSCSHPFVPLCARAILQWGPPPL